MLTNKHHHELGLPNLWANIDLTYQSYPEYADYDDRQLSQWSIRTQRRASLDEGSWMNAKQHQLVIIERQPLHVEFKICEAIANSSRFSRFLQRSVKSPTLSSKTLLNSVQIRSLSLNIGWQQESIGNDLWLQFQNMTHLTTLHLTMAFPNQPDQDSHHDASQLGMGLLQSFTRQQQDIYNPCQHSAYEVTFLPLPSNMFSATQVNRSISN